MARSRKVEANLAEERALQAFWELGYQGLGVRELEARSGINRFTLNQHYGGKTGLFLLLMDRYREMAHELIFEAVSHGGLEDVAASFEQRVRSNDMPETACFGCLVTNTVGEFADQDEDVSEKVFVYLSMVRSAFRKAILSDLEAGRVRGDLDAESTAEFLLNQALGLNVRIRLEGYTDGVIAAAERTAGLVRTWILPATT